MQHGGGQGAGAPGAQQQLASTQPQRMLNSIPLADVIQLAVNTFYGDLMEKAAEMTELRNHDTRRDALYYFFERKYVVSLPSPRKLGERWRCGSCAAILGVGMRWCCLPCFTRAPSPPSTPPSPRRQQLARVLVAIRWLRASQPALTKLVPLRAVLSSSDDLYQFAAGGLRVISGIAAARMSRPWDLATAVHVTSARGYYLLPRGIQARIDGRIGVSRELLFSRTVPCPQLHLPLTSTRPLFSSPFFARLLLAAQSADRDLARAAPLGAGGPPLVHSRGRAHNRPSPALGPGHPPHCRRLRRRRRRRRQWQARQEGRVG